MAGKRKRLGHCLCPLRPDGHLPTGEEWKERYVGEVGAGCGIGGYAGCVMCWILIDCYEVGTGFDGLCAVCAAEDEARGSEGDGALGEVVYD